MDDQIIGQLIVQDFETIVVSKDCSKLGIEGSSVMDLIAVIGIVGTPVRKVFVEWLLKQMQSRV